MLPCSRRALILVPTYYYYYEAFRRDCRGLVAAMASVYIVCVFKFEAGVGGTGGGGGGDGAGFTMRSSVLMTRDCPHDFRVPRAAAWP